MATQTLLNPESFGENKKTLGKGPARLNLTKNSKSLKALETIENTGRYKPVQRCKLYRPHGTKNQEPRTTNQYCREVLPCNLGSWFRQGLPATLGHTPILMLSKHIGRHKTGTTAQVVPAPWNQEPRLQGTTSLQHWFLVLGSRVPAQLVPLRRFRAGPVEQRTKNQDCCARPPCNLGSWFLVPRAGFRYTCTGLYRFVPACAGLYWCNTNI